MLKGASFRESLSVCVWSILGTEAYFRFVKGWSLRRGVGRRKGGRGRESLVGMGFAGGDVTGRCGIRGLVVLCEMSSSSVLRLIDDSNVGVAGVTSSSSPSNISCTAAASARAFSSS